MYRSKNLLPLEFHKMFAIVEMLPRFDYLDIIWFKTSKYRVNELDILNKKVAKIALNVDIRESSSQVYKKMAWLPLRLRRHLYTSLFTYKIMNEIFLQLFTDKFTYISGGSRDGDNCNLYTKNPSHTRNYII